MKKVKDVFVLPVKSPAWSVTNVLDADNKSVCEFKSRDQAECAGNAINHVDALADALELLIQECGKVYSNSSALGDAELKAKIALTNYRGES